MNFELVFKNLIKSIIDGNQAFYDIDDEIEWKFESKEDVNIISECNDDLVILVNTNAIKYNLDNNTMDKIEFSLLESIRHLFQKLEIEGLEFELETVNDKEVIISWKDQKNADLDAYAFAYSVMKYKYENVDCLDKPTTNLDEFNNLVNKFLKEFKEEINEVDNY